MMLDPALPTIVAVILITLVTALILRSFRQPHLVAYIVVGTVIGPHGLGLMEDVEIVSRIGAIGVVLLLFFVGIELSPSRIIKGWRVSMLGTLFQILFSVAAIWLVGGYFGWPIPRIVFFGFVISLSSTAVVLNIVHGSKYVPEKIADGTASITIMQDIALIPMLVILGLLSGDTLDAPPLAVRLLGALAMIVVAIIAVRNRTMRMPFEKAVSEDRETQTLTAFGFCLSLALFSAAVGLSTALGAFIAGLLVASFKATRWVKESTEPFRHVLMAVFFVSIGMMMDIHFVIEHWPTVVGLLSAAILINLIVGSVALKITGFSWREAIYAGTILSQIGEFSFVLAAIGLHSGLIAGFSYQATISVIALSLLSSPLMIGISGRWYSRHAARNSSSSS